MNSGRIAFAREGDNGRSALEEFRSAGGGSLGATSQDPGAVEALEWVGLAALGRLHCVCCVHRLESGASVVPLLDASYLLDSSS
jgi:hypothetical protein